MQQLLFTIPEQRSAAVQGAVKSMAAAGGDARGAVFTRAEVVGFILDLVGYTTPAPLWSLTVTVPDAPAPVQTL
jgi:hypothetical protein